MSKYYQEEIECMEHSKLEELQLERLRDVAVRCYENIPLYKQRFDEAGVDPYHIESLEDIKKFPFTVKQDSATPIRSVCSLCLAPNACACMRLRAPRARRPLWVTRKTTCRCGAIASRAAFTCLAGGEDSVVQVSYGYGLFTGGLGAAFRLPKPRVPWSFPCPRATPMRQIQIMKDFGVTILCATPSYALLIADTIAEMGMSMDEFKLTGVILGAEPCSESTRDEIRRKLGVQYCDVYGLSEIMGPGVAMECSEAKRACTCAKTSS